MRFNKHLCSSQLDKRACRHTCTYLMRTQMLANCNTYALFTSTHYTIITHLYTILHTKTKPHTYYYYYYQYLGTVQLESDSHISIGGKTKQTKATFWPRRIWLVCFEVRVTSTSHFQKWPPINLLFIQTIVDHKSDFHHVKNLSVRIYMHTCLHMCHCCTCS